MPSFEEDSISKQGRGQGEPWGGKECNRAWGSTHFSLQEVPTGLGLTQTHVLGMEFLL